jgi:hypothetical protein
VAGALLLSLLGEEREMQKRDDARRRGFLKGVFGCAALLGFMTLAGASGAAADDPCQRRIIHADRKLHEAAEHHGWESRQAEHWRHELREAREYCWEHAHRWWDQDDHRWRTERDWDDHDHDHEPH